MDEADQFYLNQTNWFLKNEDQIIATTHLILFENLFYKLQNLDIFTKNFLSSFKICKKFFHSWIQQSDRTDRNLLLLCKEDNNLDLNLNDNKVREDL